MGELLYFDIVPDPKAQGALRHVGGTFQFVCSVAVKVLDPYCGKPRHVTARKVQPVPASSRSTPAWIAKEKL